MATGTEINKKKTKMTFVSCIMSTDIDIDNYIVSSLRVFNVFILLLDIYRGLVSRCLSEILI